MECPRDATRLERQNYEGEIEVDVCPTCGGTWLDHGELERIQALRIHDHRAEVREGTDTIAASVEQARQELLPPGRCPKCEQPMDQKEYGLASQVIIEACGAGHGIWLDVGELEQLEVYFERLRSESKEPVGLAGLFATLRSYLP